MHSIHGVAVPPVTTGQVTPHDLVVKPAENSLMVYRYLIQSVWTAGSDIHKIVFRLLLKGIDKPITVALPFNHANNLALHQALIKHGIHHIHKTGDVCPCNIITFKTILV